MHIQNIKNGGTYIVKTAITGQIISKIFLNTGENKKEYPLKISAASFGIKAEEVLKEV